MAARCCSCRASCWRRRCASCSAGSWPRCAFWTTRIHAIMHLYDRVPFLFAGQVAPLSLLPGPLAALGYALPFGYMLWAPAEILRGGATVEQALVMLGAQSVWLVVELAGFAGRLAVGLAPVQRGGRVRYLRLLAPVRADRAPVRDRVSRQPGARPVRGGDHRRHQPGRGADPVHPHRGDQRLDAGPDDRAAGRVLHHPGRASRCCSKRASSASWSTSAWARSTSS